MRWLMSAKRRIDATAQRVLVVAAHPDDEILGAGATIAWHRRRGDSVSVLIMGEGVGARFVSQDGRRPPRYQHLVARLRGEMEQAHRRLGISRTFQRQFPDNRFDSVDLLDLIKAIEEVIRQVKPQILYTHHGGDVNVDHRLTFEAVLTACRPLPHDSIKRILSFEVLSSTEWALPHSARVFVPNIFVDVERFLKDKLEAMRCYRSELRHPPHPRSLHAIQRQAQLWGAKTGVNAAEAFMLIRELIV